MLTHPRFYQKRLTSVAIWEQAGLQLWWNQFVCRLLSSAPSNMGMWCWIWGTSCYRSRCQEHGRHRQKRTKCPPQLVRCPGVTELSVVRLRKLLRSPEAREKKGVRINITSKEKSAFCAQLSFYWLISIKLRKYRSWFLSMTNATLLASQEVKGRWS